MRSYFFLGIVLTLTGLAMLFIPEGFISAVVISIGVATISSGIFTLARFRNLVDDPAFRKVFTVRAIVSLAVGLVAILIPLLFAKTIWTAACYILACYLLASAALEVYAIGKLREAGISVTAYAYEIAASVIIALVLFAFPGTVGILLVRGSGALLALSGIACAVHSSLALRKHPAQ